MIVDDSTVIRTIIGGALKMLNLDIVAEAGNGPDALSLFAEHLPDVVTLDITIPEIDGMACLKEFMKIKPDARVLMITAVSDKAVAMSAMEMGAAGFLNKPVSPNALREAIERLLKK